MPDTIDTKAGSATEQAYAAGIDITVARTEHDLHEAFSLVYQSYRRAGLIPPNAEGTFHYPQALTPGACTILARLRGVPVATISAYLDTPEHGLPLDAVYKAELDELRGGGRRLGEIGLFADRREHLGRSLGVLLEMMRYATWFVVSHGVTDGIIGIHPHHAAFYQRMLCFDQIGAEQNYGAVGNRPVMLLRLDWPGKSVQPRCPRGLEHLRSDPLSRNAFERRHQLGRGQLSTPFPHPAAA